MSNNLSRFEPFRELERMSGDMTRQMDALMRDFGTSNFFNDYFGGGNVLRQFLNDRTGLFSPRVDIAEDDANMYLHIELPGVEKEHVSASVSDDRVLTIKGERKNELKENGKNFVRMERSYGSFSRSFALPENVKADAVAAEFKNGILHLTLPKSEEAKTKQIAVEIK